MSAYEQHGTNIPKRVINICNEYMYVCMYVCMYGLYVCMYVCMYVLINVCVDECMYTI